MSDSKDLQASSASASSSEGKPEGGEQTFISHLIELRSRLLRAIACVGVVLLCMLPFQNQIYSWLAAPLLAKMPGGTSMIATEVASSFYAPFVLTAFAALFVSIPFVFYQAWAFVAPGLYLNERRLALPLLISSTALFYIGVAFCYYVVFPLAFGFFTTTAPEGVTVMTDISKYLDFVIKMFLAFGFAFEVPVATFLVVRTGMISAADLAEKRRYVIVAAFTAGAILTPPDVFSQCMLSIPIWMLYEVGLLFARYVVKSEEEPNEDDGGTDMEPASTAEKP
ncbi:MAG: twin-arginine translocase subunit TatC [Proteobacteria bacterium]|nr:twin-arginine translocase subunit TatC [Pseudomonadota bacterium]